MPPRKNDPLERLAQRLDSLDYYAVLGVSANAPAATVRTAFYDLCRRLHPDALGPLPEVLRSGSQRIAQRINESYCVLGHPARRRAYDRALRENGPLRMPLVDVQREGSKQSRLAHNGETPEGCQYSERAVACLRIGDRSGAIRNWRTALAFEPRNESFQKRLEEALADVS